MRREPLQLEPGLTIERYQLLVPVAITGTCEVWAALQRDAPTSDPRQLVALRIMPGGHPNRLEIERRWRLQVHFGSRIQHPNVAHYTAMFEHRGFVCSPMEWLEGRTLSALLGDASPGISLRPTVQIVMQACKGMQAARELSGPDGRPLGLHCDLSPENLLIDTSGRVKCLELSTVDPPFLVSERTRRDPTDASVDALSLGVLLYVATTRRYPFELAPPFKLPSIHGATPAHAPFVPIPPSAVVQNYPTGLERVVMRALHPERERRFQSAAEMLDALGNALPGHASQSELAELLHSRFGRFIARERTRVNEALLRHAPEGSGGPSRLPSLPPTISHSTLSPTSVTARASGMPSAAPARSSGTPLIIAAIAAVAVFSASVVLSSSRLSRATGSVVRVDPSGAQSRAVAVYRVPAAPAQAAEAHGPEMHAPEMNAPPASATPPVLVTPVIPSGIPVESLPLISAPPSTPSKIEPSSAVRRRYGI